MSKEIHYYGLHACQAIWRMRPLTVRRAYFLKTEEARFSTFAKDLSQAKLPVKWVQPTDLEKLTDSTHHQGLCLVAEEKAAWELRPWLENHATDGAQLLLFLDGVGNPHNLGAIVRSAAHFGIAALLGEKGDLPRLTPAATRTAEGGAERVDLVRIARGQWQELELLRGQGFRLVGTVVSHEAKPLTRFIFPERTVLVLGSEQFGLSKELASLVDENIHIPGTGAVESLNVSASAAIAMMEFVRQHGL